MRTAILPVFFLAACSSQTVVVPAAPADASTPEEEQPADDDPPPAADAGPTTKIGEECVNACSAGQSCDGISATGVHVCLQKCRAKSDCPNRQDCKSGVCFPRCDEGCPAAMRCFDPAVNSCFFDCKANPALCGTGETCNGNYQCVKPAPVVTCAPGGGTPTSGITASKTVGSLTTTEQGTFCDWAAAVTGGYACEKGCTSGSRVTFAKDRAECIQRFTKPSCQATVADAEACMKENAQDVCAGKILTSATCASLRACL
jgi:hypothetical protein